MPISMPSLVVRACCCALMLPVAACGPRHPPDATTADLMEDRVALERVLLKCDRDPARAAEERACVNARIAAERLAMRNEAAQEAKRAEEFERRRENLRLADEQRRQEEQAKKVDAYHLPVVPLDAPPPGEAAKPQT